MICLKIRTFVVSATTLSSMTSSTERCDLLENSYLCGISNNNITLIKEDSMLWFAWKFVPLWYQQQPILCNVVASVRCDLLENSYLCGISNNHGSITTSPLSVVICLKIRTFVVSATTRGQAQADRGWLWFAWKFVPLWYQQQPAFFTSLHVTCCDLLENSYLCGISNNSRIKTPLIGSLWFAWKFVPLWYQQQLVKIGW